MKIWVLRPIPENSGAWEPWYDKAFGFVGSAPDKQTARKIANKNGGDEIGRINSKVYRTGGDPWLDPEQSTCEELVTSDKAEVILRDFKSA